jgi:hypothetical protein
MLTSVLCATYNYDFVSFLFSDGTVVSFKYLRLVCEHCCRYFHSPSLQREVDGREYRRLHQQLTVKISMKMVCVLIKCVVKHNMVSELKQDQLDATDSGLFHQLYLNMFRASLCPSSGE